MYDIIYEAKIALRHINKLQLQLATIKKPRLLSKIQ